MWHRFEEGLRQAILQAAAESERRGIPAVSTAHLLWAIVRTPDCTATKILSRLGIEPLTWPAGAEPEIGCRSGLTPEARRALDGAYQEAADLGDSYIGSEHLLLAFVRRPDTAAAKALNGQGITLDRVAEALMREQAWRDVSPAGTRVPGLRARRLQRSTRAFLKRAFRQIFALTHLREPFMPYRLFRRKTNNDPYPFYRRLRRTPLYWDGLAYMWVVTGYQEVAAVLQEPRFSHQHYHLAMWGRDELPEMVEREFRTLNSTIARQILFLDAPDQTRIRSLIGKQFTPRVVEGMRARIQQITDDLLNSVAETGRMEVMRDLALPLPASVMAALLGVPRKDQAQFKEWSDDFITYIGAVGGTSTLPQELAVRRSLVRLCAYFREAIARLRCAPEDTLLSLLVEAQEQGNRLTEEEIVANCLLLVVAGNNTTTQMIGNGLLALLRYPEQLERLRAEPGLMADAVEEMLRYDSPVQWTNRITRERFEWHGKWFEKGQLVCVGLAAANRDPAQFPDPDRLEIARPSNRHLAFGYGSHYCVGAALARMEAQTALETLLRFSNLRLAPQKIAWQDNFTFRGPMSLHVAWD